MTIVAPLFSDAMRGAGRIGLVISAEKNHRKLDLGSRSSALAMDRRCFWAFLTHCAALGDRRSETASLTVINSCACAVVRPAR